MKYKIYNTDEHFGDEECEYFDTLEAAEERLEEIKEELFDLHVEEACDNARHELTDQINSAIILEEENEEE